MTKIFEESEIDFNNFESTFLSENEELCNQQKDYLTVVTERKIEGMKNSVLQYQGDFEKKERHTKSMETRIKNTQEKYEMQIRSIENKTKARCSYNDVGMGIIKIV